MDNAHDPQAGDIHRSLRGRRRTRSAGGLRDSENFTTQFAESPLKALKVSALYGKDAEGIVLAKSTTVASIETAPTTGGGGLAVSHKPRSRFKETYGDIEREKNQDHRRGRYRIARSTRVIIRRASE